MEPLTLQEIFDSQVHFTPAQVSVILGFNRIWDKFSDEAKLGTFSPSYYKAFKELADEHELKYTEPMYRSGLREVPMSPTVH